MADAHATPPLTDAERSARSSSFGSVADHYERSPARPDGRGRRLVLPAAVDCAVDLGAGTGALTRLLVAVACDVVAVEPDDRMRALVAEVPTARALAGRGEAIPVPDTTRRRVCSGSSSWHWMDPVPTLAEIHRVLVPGGVFGAVWTGPDPDGPFMNRRRRSWPRCAT